jgi:hypothetical protein
MPDPAEDFWPDEIPDPTDPAAVALLKEQAEILGSKMRGEIEGVVRTYAENGIVYYSLYLKADALGNYLYKLLEIGYPVIGQSVENREFTAQGCDGGASVTIKSDEEFREWLRDQLSSEYVRSALGNLRRYVRDRQATRVG